MVLLNFWVLFGLIPLYLIYRRHLLLEINYATKLLYLSLFFMFLAMARPALSNHYHNEKLDSEDFVIALDASFSMQAEDIKPNRFEAAKQTIAKLMQEHPKDRFTLFAFTSNALLISPPTTDTAISMAALNTLNPEYILSKSTSLYNLLKTVAKLPMKQKNLILLSDGGDEHELQKLVEVAKEGNIRIFVVATATQKGAALKKEGRYIKDIYSSIVVSKINPILKELAKSTSGKYYEIGDVNLLSNLSQDMTQKTKHKENVKIQSYEELFYIPLSLAALLFLLGVTRLQKLLLALFTWLSFTHNADASVLDFVYLDEANTLYKKHSYAEAAKNFQKLSPSVQSYYNTANAYYKAGHYKTALNYYSKIKTRNKDIKAAVFYNMGNCAVKLKRYDRAQKFYIQSLALKEDADALYNLNLLRKMALKTGVNIADMLPPKNPKQKKNSSKSTSKQKQKQNSSKGKNNSNQQAPQGSSTGNKTKKASKQMQKSTKKEKNLQYNLGYKAYEIINKGYTDEKQPW